MSLVKWCDSTVHISPGSAGFFVLFSVSQGTLWKAVRWECPRVATEAGFQPEDFSFLIFVIRCQMCRLYRLSDGSSDGVWCFGCLLERAVQGMSRQRGKSSKAIWTLDAEQKLQRNSRRTARVSLVRSMGRGFKTGFPQWLGAIAGLMLGSVRKSPELSGWSDLQLYQSPHIPTSIYWIVPFVNLMWMNPSP